MLDYKFEDIYEKLKSPCKKCLVKSCCTSHCEAFIIHEKNKIKAWNMGNKIESGFFFTLFMTVFLSIVIVFCLGFYKLYEIIRAFF